REMMRRTWGGSAGAQRLGPRDLRVAGFVYTRTPAATAYARTWLYEALSGGTCGGNCDLPDAVVGLWCDRTADGAGLRSLRRVILTGWDPNVDLEFPTTCGFEFEAVLSSEVPYIYETDPTIAYDGPAIDPDAEEFC